MLAVTWYPVVDDLIGGWAVANVDKPPSQHDHASGDREIASFINEETARHIARLHNEYLKQKVAYSDITDSHEGS